MGPCPDPTGKICSKAVDVYHDCSAVARIGDVSLDLKGRAKPTLAKSACKPFSPVLHSKLLCFHGQKMIAEHAMCISVTRCQGFP